MRGLIWRIFPVPILMKVNESRPRLSPVAMLKVSGVATRVINAGNAFGKIVPVHFGERGAHERAHQNQRRSGRVGRNGGDERGAENRRNKKCRR